MNAITIALSGFILGVSAPYIFKASLQGLRAWGLM
jgi:hypothetical protein